jgi:hypothetical protein
MMSFGKYIPIFAITLILTACGGGGMISPATVASVPDTPVAVNRAPVISGTPATSVDQGSGYQFSPVATDADGDTLSFQVVNLPAWANFDSTRGKISGTPTSGDVGIYSNIVISVSDGTTTSALAPFSISVLSGGGTQLGGQIGFSVSTQSVIEGAVVSLTIARTNSAGAASVMYATHGVTAVSSTLNGDDYQGFDPVAVTFADGETSKVVTVQTLDNNVQESAETFEVYLTSPSAGYVLSSNAVDTVTINDNDAAITAQAAKGSMDLSWSAPAARTDGSSLPLSDIDGYAIYIGTTSDNLEMQVDLNDGSMTSYTIKDLAAGTYYVALTTYDVNGISSSYSNVVQKTVTATN